MDSLKWSRAKVTGVISATRGNHGESIKFSAARAGIPATIYVPHGNSADQNAAMRAFGAAVVEFGRDFDEALGECHVRVAVCRQVARRATHRSIGANTMARTSEKSPKIAKKAGR